MLIRINPNDYAIYRKQDISIPMKVVDGVDLVTKLFKGEKA